MKELQEKLQNLKTEALAQILSATSKEELEGLRIAFLGRNGEINKVSQKLRGLDGSERVAVGRLLNDVREVIESNLQLKVQEILEKNKISEWFDPTVPGIKPKRGHLHLVTWAIEEIADVFKKIGFVRVRYPELEWDWYAFGSLNMPKDHPARDEWETFFVDVPPHKKYGQMVLTPHTSSGQVREMERILRLRSGQAPIRMINIAKCYRRQQDVSHVPMFHQFEGLVIDKNISIVNLKGTLDYFARNFFGEGRKTRLRPFHFRFTEPSFEVDVSCGVCGGKGCSLCKSGWLELGGAGMVHPNVLKNGGIDPTKYSGFAFGWGVERTFMMKEDLGIEDIRTIYSSDLRYLRQF